MKKAFRLSRGFTLVELLIVIAIIGILATTALTQLGSARGKARDAKRVADIAQISTAIEAYNEANSAYPADIADATLAPYISGTKVPLTPTGTAYQYARNGNPVSNYHLYVELEHSGGATGKPKALDTDADINSTGWTGNALNASGAATEACTTAANDCVFDVGQD